MSWLNVDWLKHETEVFLDEIRIINGVYDRMFDEFDAACAIAALTRLELLLDQPL